MKSIFSSKFKAEHFEPERNELCICGSGLKFKKCCAGVYSAVSAKSFRISCNSGDYEKALLHGRRYFTWYALSHKAHTVPLLESNSHIAQKLLSIDIEALAALLDNLHLCYFHLKRSTEFPEVIDRVRNLIDDTRWTNKIAYMKGLWHLIDQKNEKESLDSLSSIDLPSCKDPDILSLYLQVCPKDISLSESLRIIDIIVSNTPKESIRLQYRVLKALKFYLICQQQEGDTLLEESIAIFEKLPRDKQSVQGRMWLAHALEIYGRAGGRNDILEKAKQVVSDLIRETDGQKFTGNHIGNLYRLLADCEEDIGNHAAATIAYARSLSFDPNELTKVFLARSVCNDGDISKARGFLSAIKETLLDDPGRFDLAISWALLAATSLQSNDINIAMERMKAVKVQEPIFIQLRDRWIIDLLETIPASKPGAIRRLIRMLNCYITLNPNFFGVGININKVIDDIDSATINKN